MSNRRERKRRRLAVQEQHAAELQQEQDRRASERHAADRAFFEADAYARDKSGRSYSAVIEQLYATAEEPQA